MPAKKKTKGQSPANKAGASKKIDLAKIISNVATTMFVVDKDLTITHISDPALKALGYTRDEVVGKMTCADLCKTPLCGTANCTVKNCMRTGENIVGETEAQTRDGAKIPIAAACSAIFDDDGNPIGGMEAIFDQTNQKTALREIGSLIAAAGDGKLDQRADADKLEGDFKDLCQGVNRLLDAVVGPLNVAAEYVDRISKGDIPEKITDEYNGDFNEIKNNLNQCIDAVGMLVADASMLAQAGAEGKLDTRADSSKHQGDFREIVNGVNNLIDAVVLPINEAATVLDAAANKDLTQRVKGTYKGQLDDLKTSINATIGALDDALSQVTGNKIRLEQAAKDWQRTIFEPFIKIIERSPLPKAFPGRTPADLYAYITFHHWKNNRERKYGIDLDQRIPQSMEKFRAAVAEKDKPEMPEMKRVTTAFVMISVESRREDRVMEKLYAHKEVRELHFVPGEFDILLKIAVERDLLSSDSEAVGNFLRKHVRAINGVIKTQTIIPISSKTRRGYA